MRTDALVCQSAARRYRLFGNSNWNGLDFLDVSEDQRSLCVHFFGPVPEWLTLANIWIAGGRRIRDIKAIAIDIHRSLDPELADCLRITLDKPGDFSTYTLCLIDPDEKAMGKPPKGIDPRFASLCFTFKTCCSSDLDCKPTDHCVPVVAPPPEINYLAKDYTTFRQVMLDRLAQTMPEWRERHIPDLGITLVELLAYVGDYLSYYQDAVATEAYLDTARQRISVRRHARLVDYQLHEGVNARAWVTIWTAADLDPLPANSLYFITGVPDLAAHSGRVVNADDLAYVPRSSYEVFEPLVDPPDRPLTFYAAHSEIAFYTWGDHECCLAKGATRATLIDEAPRQTSDYEPKRILHLQAGDVLIFEEVLGPNTGSPADADPLHRHAVRITSVTPNVDELIDHRLLLEITWAREDALPFSLCLSSRLPAPDCRRIDGVSVARGNIVLVDHGRTEAENLGPVGIIDSYGACSCEGSVIEWTSRPARFNPQLSDAPLTFAEPVPAVTVPASRAIVQDVRAARPVVWLRAYLPQDIRDGADAKATGPRWDARGDLLASHADDRHFVAEIDEDGRAHLRFGDAELGRQPGGGTLFQATERIGNGPAGNVGRETITYLVIREGTLSADAIRPRNPLPARGGAPAETLTEARLLAPHAFRERLERAIIADDYATLAQRNPRVQRAAGELRWTGSWYEARVAIDPAGTDDPQARTLAAVTSALFAYRRMGHDLDVVQAQYVPLDVALDICVCPQFDRGHVKAALLEVLGSGVRPDGTLGLFHPDNLSFGDGVYLSTIIAAAKSVAGVESAVVTRCKRLDAPAGDELDTGVLVLDAMEVARLDNDPNFPEHGTLELTLRGGR
jgi:hypothetical protein